MYDVLYCTVCMEEYLLLLRIIFVPCLHKHLNTVNFGFVYAIAVSVTARAGQLQFALEASNTFRVRFQQGHRVHKYYAYCNSVKSL